MDKPTSKEESMDINGFLRKNAARNFALSREEIAKK